MVRKKTFAEKMFESHLQQLRRVHDARGQAGLRKLYSDALKDLRAQLASAPAQQQAATQVQLRAMIAQIEGVLTVLGRNLGKHLEDVGALASELGARHGVDEYKRLSKHFTGTTPVLQLDNAAVFKGMVADVDQSLLRRYRRQTQTWALGAIGEMERKLAVGALAGKPLHDMITDVTKAGGMLDGERWKAERIVRTEMAYAHGASKFSAMKRTAADLGERKMMKKLIATFDDRTGDDSFLVHGQAVPLDQPFAWKHKRQGQWVVDEYQHPPNRPNDREVVIPWDAEWEEMAGFEAPLTRAELRAARPTRWRDTIGVQIPPGHNPGKPYRRAS